MFVWLALALGPSWLVSKISLVVAQQWAELGVAMLSTLMVVGCLQLLASPGVMRASGWRMLYAVVLLHAVLYAASGVQDVRSVVLRPMWMLLMLTNVWAVTTKIQQQHMFLFWYLFLLFLFLLGGLCGAAFVVIVDRAVYVDHNTSPRSDCRCPSPLC